MAFAECYRATYPAVHGFAQRGTGRDGADDVVAETFATVWARWADVPVALDEQRAWVFGVARNKVRDAQRSMARRRRLAVKVAVLPLGLGPDPQESAVAMQRAYELLDELPPEQRDAVWLTVLVGLSCAEAAEALGCSVSAVTSRVSRARARLRERLEGQEVGSDA